MARSAVVFGAGGFGREALAWYSDAYPTAEVVGFLDADDSKHSMDLAGLSVLGDFDWLKLNAVDDIILGVGPPKARRTVTDRLNGMGREPTTVVHPSATIGDRVELGSGTIVCPGVILTVDIVVGRGCLLNLNVTLGHDVRLGDFAVLAPGVDIAGNVTVEDGADVGIGAAAIQGLTIGAWSTIGGGAVVVNHIPAEATAVGVPARPLAERGGG